MPFSTPIGGFPIPQNGDPYDIEASMTSLVRDNLDGHIPGIFGSVAERDIAYSTWVAAGHALIDGVSCFVAGRPMVYRAGAWRGLKMDRGVYVPATRQLPLGREDDIEDSFVQVTVPDPGYPYWLKVEATAATIVTNCAVDIRVRAGNGRPDPQLDVITHSANWNGIQDVTTPARPTGVLTGPSRIIGYALRGFGTGAWQITAASLYYELIPD